MISHLILNLNYYKVKSLKRITNLINFFLLISYYNNAHEYMRLQKGEVELNLITKQDILSFEPLSREAFTIAYAISLVVNSSLQKFIAS